MKSIYKMFLMTVALCCAFLISCSTTLPVVVERPAELDLGGADTIAVLPFQVTQRTAGNNAIISNIIDFFSYFDTRKDDASQVAEYITSGLTEGLARSEYVELVYSDSVQNAVENGKKAPCDVYLTGGISRFETAIEHGVIKTEENGVEKYNTVFYRTISFTVTYQVIDADTNKVISYRSVDIDAESSAYEKERYVDSAVVTVEDKLDNLIDSIMREIQPYEETKYISLLNDKTKDPEMKEAHQLAKNGLLVQAEELFTKLYETHHYFEAAYNAAILMEAQGRLKDAEAAMEELVRKYGDKRAISALKDIRKEIQSAERLQSQLTK